MEPSQIHSNLIVFTRSLPTNSVIIFWLLCCCLFILHFYNGVQRVSRCIVLFVLVIKKKMSTAVNASGCSTPRSGERTPLVLPFSRSYGALFPYYQFVRTATRVQYFEVKKKSFTFLFENKFSFNDEQASCN